MVTLKPGEAFEYDPQLEPADVEIRTAPGISRHAAAAADMLEIHVKRLRNGAPPEDLGWEVERIGAMMARAI